MPDPYMKYPCPFIRSPISAHTHTIILLHGTSTDGPTFAEPFLSFPIPTSSLSVSHLTSTISSPSNENPLIKVNDTSTKTLTELFPSCRFVFPTGRLRPCTVLGRDAHAWFDFVSFSDRIQKEQVQIEGLAESTRYLAELVNEEAELLGGGEEGRRRVVLGGFSQGCAMTAVAVLSGEIGRVGGVVGMSGWLPFRRQICEVMVALPEHGEGAKVGFGRVSAVVEYVRKLLNLSTLSEGAENGVLETRMFIGHGEEDAKMKMEWGEEMYDTLLSLGVVVRLETFVGLEHWWNGEEMVQLVDFLNTVWEQ